VRSITISGGKLYFVAGDNIRGSELWVSDGTEAGTQVLANLGTGNNWPPNTLTDVNGTLYFTMIYYDQLNFIIHNQVWKTDGTIAGNELIADFTEGYAIRQMINVNGKAFFVFTSFYTGMELYTSDGTAAGTFMVAISILTEIVILVSDFFKWPTIFFCR
jgi:ELWxxDGT repeat protein